MFIIADDLTGANDSAIQFARLGIGALVITDNDHIPEPSFLSRYAVISMSTDTRWMDPRAAYDTVRVATAALMRNSGGRGNCYKKIDSMLRGNTAIEVEAMMDALDIERALVAPTYPEQGRIVEHGVLIAGDRRVDAVRLFSQAMRRHVAGIPLAIVRAGKLAVAAHIEKTHANGVRVWIADAVTHEDLSILAASSSANMLHAGSAGLASHLAHSEPSQAHFTLAELETRTVVLVGTRTIESVRQMTVASETLGIPILQLAVERIMHGESNMVQQELIAEMLSQNREVTLVAVSSIFGGGTEDPIEAHAIASAMGTLAKRIVESMGRCNLVTTGGDISLQVCSAIGAFGIEPVAEILPGIPLGRIVGGKAERLPIVTKSGGFGNEMAIVDIIRKLHSDNV